MPASEFAYISGTSPTVQMSSTKSSKAAVSEKPAAVSGEYAYDSDDEIAAAKAEHYKAPSPKSTILSKVKAKLQSDKRSTHTAASSSKSRSDKNQARADTVFAYKVLAETRP